jgi:hypothetical protein
LRPAREVASGDTNVGGASAPFFPGVVVAVPAFCTAAATLAALFVTGRSFRTASPTSDGPTFDLKKMEFLDINLTKDSSFFSPCYSQSLLLADF